MRVPIFPLSRTLDGSSAGEATGGGPCPLHLESGQVHVRWKDPAMPSEPCTNVTAVPSLFPCSCSVLFAEVAAARGV